MTSREVQYQINIWVQIRQAVPPDGELQHSGAQLGACEYPHTCAPHLGNFGKDKSLAHLQEFGSRTSDVHGGEPNYI